MGYVLDWQELEPSDEIGHGPQATHTIVSSVVSVGAGTWPTIDAFRFDEGNHPPLG
ncbi:hypothetical protein [Lentzea waywayandensis]|uniref:hypothetical protein n=1 Tax=Lentzea waywayandensis TaxID=84724 RepID=UPI0015A642B7|nr:hypothetical protein [Lentzea waywayandensis]